MHVSNKTFLEQKFPKPTEIEFVPHTWFDIKNFKYVCKKIFYQDGNLKLKLASESHPIGISK